MKPTLHATKRGDDICYVIVSKTPDFFAWLEKVVSFLGIHDDVTHYDYYGKSGQVRRKKHIRAFTDRHEAYDGNSRVDLFYGKSQVFIVATGPRAEDFINHVCAESRWTKQMGRKPHFKKTAS